MKTQPHTVSMPHSHGGDPDWLDRMLDHAPEPEPCPVQPLASLIRSLFAPAPDTFSCEQEEDAYYHGIEDLYDEINERLDTAEGRVMDAAPRLLAACRQADAVLRELYDPSYSEPGLVYRHIRTGETLQQLLEELDA